MSYFWKMCLWPQNKFRSRWPIFHGPVIFPLLFFALKNILVLLAKLNSGELRCPATALIDRIIIKVAGNQDRHNSSDEFDFGPLVSMAHLYIFWNEIWPWHIGLRWAIVALWATCLNKTMKRSPCSATIFKIFLCIAFSFSVISRILNRPAQTIKYNLDTDPYFPALHDALQINNQPIQHPLALQTQNQQEAGTW